MEKKKVKFNGIDVFIILMVIAVIAAGLYFLKGRSSAAGAAGDSKNVNVTTVVELTGREKDFADKVKENDLVMLGEKDKAPMTVTKVEVTPAKTTGYDILSGHVYNSEIPTEYDVKVTLCAPGAESNKSIDVSGIALKVGQETVVSSKAWAGYGYIISLETADAN